LWIRRSPQLTQACPHLFALIVSRGRFATVEAKYNAVWVAQNGRSILNAEDDKSGRWRQEILFTVIFMIARTV